MTSTQTKAKVEKLLAMTSSSHTEEARTAATMACRLIVEHNLLSVGGANVVDRALADERIRKVQLAADLQSAEAWKRARKANEEVTRLTGLVASLQREVEELQLDAAAWRAHCAKTQLAKAELEVVAYYQAKWGSTCKTCGAPIHVGDEIAWHGSGKGVSCARHFS